MRNFHSSGDAVSVTAPADVASGDLVIVGALIGVATADAANGASLEIVTRGAFRLTKDTSVVAQGSVIYWDESAGACTEVATDNTRIGVAIAASPSDTPSCLVRLDG